MNRLPPQDCGRDPLTASFRLFSMLREELAEAQRRLVRASYVVTDAARIACSARAVLSQNPILMKPTEIRKAEALLQALTDRVGVVSAAVTGVGGKLTASQSLTCEGVKLERSFPQPSLN